LMISNLDIDVLIQHGFLIEGGAASIKLAR
jgi:hypothetical protein